MDRRRKASDEDTAFGSGKNFVETAADGALAGRVSPPLNIGGVLEQHQHALFFAVFGKGVQVKQPVVGGRGVNFEIAGMDNYANRRVDGQGNTVHQAVRYLNGIDGEWSQGKAASGPNLAQVGTVEQLMLFQLVFDQGQRKFRAENRHVQLRKDPGQSADMVFMAVSQDNAADLVAVVEQVGDVGNDDVHAQQFRFGKHQAGVHDHDVVAPANGHAVHSELAQPAQRHYMEFSHWHSQ